MQQKKIREFKRRSTYALAGASMEPKGLIDGFNNDKAIVTALLDYELLSDCPEISVVFDLRTIEEKTFQRIQDWRPFVKSEFLKHLVYGINFQMDFNNPDLLDSPCCVAAAMNIEYAPKKDGEMEAHGHLHVVFYGTPYMKALLVSDQVFGGKPGLVACFFEILLKNFFSVFTEPGTYEQKVLRLTRDDFKGAVSIANFATQEQRLVYRWSKHRYSQFDYIIKNGIQHLMCFVSRRVVSMIYDSRMAYNSNSDYYHHHAVPQYFPSHKANYSFLYWHVMHSYQGPELQVQLEHFRKYYSAMEEDTSVQMAQKRFLEQPHVTPEGSFIAPSQFLLKKRTIDEQPSKVPELKKSKAERNEEIIAYFEQLALAGQAFTHNEIFQKARKEFGVLLDDKVIKQVLMVYACHSVQVKLPNPEEMIRKWLDSQIPEIWALLQDEQRAIMYIYPFFRALIVFLKSPLGQGLLIWIRTYYLKSSDERKEQLNKILYLYGPSSSGKSAILDMVFPRVPFSPANLIIDSRYAVDNVYDPACTIWLYSDVNRNVTSEFLFRLQNLANGDESLEIKHKNRKTSTDVFRPLVICSTWDVEKKFSRDTEKGAYAEMNNPLFQFSKRLYRLNLPSPTVIMDDLSGDFYPSNIVTDCFRACFGAGKLPPFFGTFFFWLMALNSDLKTNDVIAPDAFIREHLLKKHNSIDYDLRFMNICSQFFETDHFVQHSELIFTNFKDSFFDNKSDSMEPLLAFPPLAQGLVNSPYEGPEFSFNVPPE